mmetsp:Transcript_109762/g.310233  ORF Transcript_109762/g.310233 Transcript_109762/m.310233 type:complete len:144 (+) Transcript_109762:541-972(+)
MFAPGSDITSDGLYGPESVLSGTSMACPFVAGAAALLLQRGTPPQDVARVLAATATRGVVTDAGPGSPNLLLFVGNATSLPASAGSAAIDTAECSAHPGCKGKQGHCCPTPGGKRQACCSTGAPYTAGNGDSNASSSSPLLLP